MNRQFQSCLRRFSTRRIPILNHIDLDTTKLHLVNQEAHSKLGPIYSSQVGPDVNVVWISDANMAQTLFRSEPQYPIHVVPECWRVFNERSKLERGLFFLDGKDWYDMRKKMNPMFLKNLGLAQAGQHSQKITDDVIHHLKSMATESEEPILVDLEKLLHEWSVKSTLAAIYGELLTKSIDLGQFVGYVHEMFDSSAILQTKSAELEANSNSPDWQTFSNAASSSFEFLNQNFRSLPKTDGLAKLLKDAFNEEEVLRIVNDLIIAAADTTSYTTLWTLYLLATHPNYQEKDLDIRAIMKESMRLFPVAPFLTRIQQEPFEIEGYVIEAGQLVLISTYAMGRDKAYFPEPNDFQPERWSRINGKLKGVNNSFASLPFGFGARSCIGKKMAEQQIDHFLNEFFKHFHLTCVNDGQVNMIMRMIGLPDSKIVFKITLK